MSVKSDAKKALQEFEKSNSKYKGKAYLTSGNRTWKEQLLIIIDAKRKNNYTNIKARFKKKYKLTDVPKSLKKMTDVQLKWWETEIGKQAGKSPGFPHVGGKAQDISVKNLDTAGKKLLKAEIEKQKLSVLMEKVTGSTSKYGVSIEKANVFHCYEK